MFGSLLRWIYGMAGKPPRFQCKVCGAWHGGLYGNVCPDCHKKGLG